VAKSLTYDADGRISGLTLPRSLNPYGTFTYDLEDKVVMYGVTGASGLTVSGEAGSANCCEAYKYSTRNEVPGMNVAGAQLANGAICTVLTGACTFDSRSGQMLEQQAPYGGVTTGHNYAYDAAGRETTDTQQCGGVTSGTDTRTYDTDNHLAQQAITSGFNPGTQGCGGNQLTYNYTWSADGRLANFSQTEYTGGSPPSITNTFSAHWDGDTLLYVSYEGTLMMLYTEKLGFSLQGSNGSWSTLVYDRDQTGTAVNTHFETGSFIGFTAMNLENVRPYTPPAMCKGGPISSIECSGSSSAAQQPSAGGSSYGSMTISVPGALLDAKREDGYYDGTVAIQGARAYDPNMNQWTTPDAYSGDVHDPMSQHPYMWNNNNPVQYSDPSGYVVSGLALEALLPSNSDIYVKVEVNAGPFHASMTFTGKSGFFVSGGAAASKSAATSLASGKFKVGASAMAGVIVPKPGKKSGDVVKGASVGASGGDVLGAEAWGNANGSAAGVGLTTPGLTPISGSYGVQMPSSTPSTSSASQPPKQQ
jgi:RHS repeat-associated protein